MQPNELLAWQNFIMQKVGVTLFAPTYQLEAGGGQCGVRLLAGHQCGEAVA
jgi:hypothetical protein